MCLYTEWGWCFQQKFDGRGEKSWVSPIHWWHQRPESIPVCLLYAPRAGRRFMEELLGVQSPSDYRGEAGSFHVTRELWIRRGAEGIASPLSPSTMPEHVSHQRNRIWILQTYNTDRQVFSLWTPKEMFQWMSWTAMESHLPWLYFRRFR